MQYIAFLRGINVGGNNKIAMPILKQALAKHFPYVATYLNTGNVIFDAESKSTYELAKLIESEIKTTFELNIAVTVIDFPSFAEDFTNAPAWWGSDDDCKHNAIFVITPHTPKEIVDEVGAIKPEYEQIKAGNHTIFWSAPKQTFSRTRWASVSSRKSYQFITIRNYNTTSKLYDMMRARVID